AHSSSLFAPKDHLLPGDIPGIERQNRRANFMGGIKTSTHFLFFAGQQRKVIVVPENWNNILGGILIRKAQVNHERDTVARVLHNHVNYLGGSLARRGGAECHFRWLQTIQTS